MRQGLSNKLMRNRASGLAWIGVGTGVLLGLAVGEIIGGVVSIPAGIVVAAIVVVMDRLTRGVARAIFGVVAASVALYRLLSGYNCAEVITDPSFGGVVVVAAVFAWLIALVMGGVSSRSWYGTGINALLMVFGLLELAVFVVSPAGLPVVTIYPAPVQTVMLVITIGFGVWAGIDPRTAEEAIGWCLALVQVFIASYLVSHPLGSCGAEAWVSVAMAATGGATAFAVSRLFPVV